MFFLVLSGDFLLNSLLILVVGEEESQGKVLILFRSLLVKIVLDLCLDKLMQQFL